MRLFVAVELPSVLRERLSALLAPARGFVEAPSGLRWLAPEVWHLTLHFLGDVDPERVPPLEAACRAAAAEHAPFELTLGDAGAFGSARKARVLWVGVQAGGSQLAALAHSVQARTAALGLPAEARAFSPHVTVARANPPVDLRPLLARLAVPACAQQVRELTLFRSQLSQHGARYEPLLRAALTGSGAS